MASTRTGHVMSGDGAGVRERALALGAEANLIGILSEPALPPDSPVATPRPVVLFLNAGVSGPKHQSVDAVTEAELGALLMTNATAPLRIARRLLPNVVDGGTIAFMSSRMGSVADNQSGGMDLYRASKAALNSLTRGFAATAAPDRKVSVLTLHPGWVRTDMGGASAPLSIEQSVTGVADVLEAPRTARHVFLDYQGLELPW